MGPLTELLRENANRDKYLRHAGLFALAEIDDKTAIQKLATDRDAAVRLAACLVMRRWADAGIARFLQDDDIWIVTEAARAINDLPLDGGTGELAALAERLSANEYLPEPLARRIINANFRLGGRAMAGVSLMAENARLPLPIRREALAAFADWKNPPQRDRVTGNWRPLPGRDAEPLRQFLQPRVAAIIAANRRDLAAEAINLVARLELNTDAALFVDWIRDRQHPAATRIAALDALAVLKSAELPMLVDEVLKEDNPAMRAAALRVLATTEPEKATPLIAAVLDGKNPTGGSPPTIAEQQQAIVLLGDGPLAGKLPVPETALLRIAAEELPLPLALDWLAALGQRKEPAAAAALRKLAGSARPARCAAAAQAGPGGGRCGPRARHLHR